MATLQMLISPVTGTNLKEVMVQGRKVETTKAVGTGPQGVTKTWLFQKVMLADLETVD